MAKGGGSQLKQLKAKLHTAGVTDRRQQSQKSKQRKGGLDEKEAAAARRNKINNIVSSLNPFDEKVTKLKHDVLGRKVKGATGRPGAAKASGLAQRRATLLPEWQARNKSGSFVDRRFGENDANMTPEEKMLERFTVEKQRRASKGAMYNLNDGEDEGLTHYGQSLSGFDDLADIGLADEEEEGEYICLSLITMLPVRSVAHVLFYLVDYDSPASGSFHFMMICYWQLNDPEFTIKSADKRDKRDGQNIHWRLLISAERV